MHVRDAAAALADDVVVWMLVGRLEVCAMLTEVRTSHEPVLHEHVERAVDGRRVHVRDEHPDPFAHLVRAQVLVGNVREHAPDGGTLPRQPPTANPQRPECGRLVSVVGCVILGSVAAKVGHGRIMTRQRDAVMGSDASEVSAAGRETARPRRRRDPCTAETA